jgi:23S rRNA pseudouridine1911/1915/1917 synthase
LGYVKNRYYIKNSIKAFLFLIRELHLSQKESQRFLDNRRVLIENRVVDKTETLLANSCVDILEFIPTPKGLKPIFQTKDFAIYDKPSGILVHPSRMDSQYSLLDEIKYSFGKDANIVHRIDKETSGLILVSKNRKSEIALKNMFENREIKKSYQALIRGKLYKKIVIHKPLSINQNSNSKEKIIVSKNGKKSTTIIEPLKILNENSTLINIELITGRQHQVRVHLNSINHSILGEPIYGVDYSIASKYLDAKLSIDEKKEFLKAKRLMLNSSYLEFSFYGIIYKIKSKIDLINEFRS